jgi:phenylpropionate dioxygenase-like ring-hydroxylating dioxygenase large terminal subunit
MSTGRVGYCFPALRNAWHVVAASDEVTAAPSQVWLLGEAWCLVRIAGEVAAFADRCPHRGAALSAGRADSLGLRCAYHGWCFDADGTCVEVPSLRSLDDRVLPSAALTRPYAVIERYGLVWLAPAAPHTDLPDFPQWRAAGFDCARAAIVRTTVGAAQLVDNFLDAAHFPYVHPGTFGTDAAAAVVDRGPRRSGWEVENTFETWYRNRDDRLVATGEHPEVQPQVLSKVGRAALTVVLRLEFPMTGATIGILFCCTPECDGVTRVYKIMARNDLDGDQTRLDAFVADENRILEEDLAILSRYRSREVPLDLRAEVHTRGDRLSVAWRHLLVAALGATEAET